MIHALRSLRRETLAALFLLGSLGAVAAGVAARPPADDPARLARIDSVFAAYDRPNSPGCAIGIVQDGQLVVARGYGLASLELNVAITPQTVFDVGSVSKQFTAFCVHSLIQDGKLSLEDPVRKYIPELPAYAKPIRIRHLLHHTSGLRDYNDLLVLAGHYEADRTTKEQALDIVVHQTALNFPPGTKHLYSNTGYFLLSMIVERVSGQSLRDFAARRIFTPLGMSHSQFNDHYSRIIPNRALGYAPADSGFENDMSYWEQTGDGAVQTSVEDLVKWVNNFHTAAVGGRALIDAMQSPGRLDDGSPLTYASGLDTEPWNGLRCVRHNGAWAGYRADVARFPDQHAAVICLSNLANASPEALNNRVAGIWLADALAEARGRAGTAPDPTDGLAALPTAPLPAGTEAHYLGSYRSPEVGVLEVTLADGRLAAGGGPVQVRPLRPLGADRFERVGSRTPGLYTFHGPVDRPADYLELNLQGRAKPLHFERVVPWHPAAAQLRGLAGRYRSAELGVDATLEWQDAGLVLEYPALGSAPLVPTTSDTFRYDTGELRIERAAGGRVTGFTLSTRSELGMRFTRV